MISLIKQVFMAGVVIVALASLSAMIQNFNTQTNGGAVDRPEYAIPVPHESRPVLAPCDVEDDDPQWVHDLENAWKIKNELGALAEIAP